MVEVTYRVVEHDGGWAYQLGGVFSETFRTRAEAAAAADRVAALQRVPGENETIEWEDEGGIWHEETASGSDRPDTTVADLPARRAPSGRTALPAAATAAPASPLLLTLALAGLAGLLLATVVRRRPPSRSP